MRRPLLPLLALLVAGCSSDVGDVNAVRRGDVAFAQGDFDEALAEYRLAIQQGVDEPEVTARVAHTYAMMGRVDDAGEYYVDAAARDAELTDQAVSELMRLARDAHTRNDRFAMATAIEIALELRPGLGVGDMALPLARHYFQNGQHGRALPFYQKALAGTRDSLPEIVFEVGRAHEEIGDCEKALIFFERFRQMVRAWERAEVDWYIGTCTFNIAKEILASRAPNEERLERALALVDRTVQVGEPRNILAQALFDKGEILADLGRCQEAMDAYAQVRYADQAGALMERAQTRFDEIRFGVGLEHLRDGRCR